ncbi:MAG: diguanylate cyclase [Agitococcus sp.]|nr:diguanylate cyclase [Agitococcus sp.]
MNRNSALPQDGQFITEEPSKPQRTLLKTLADAVLGKNRQQRLRIARSLMAAMVFSICVGVIFYLSVIGQIIPQQGAILSGCIFVSCGGFYVALRTGFNLRFAEPSLTLPQTLAALTWICGAYAIGNAAHGGTLMLFALVLVFAIFTMSIRRSIISASYGVVAMAATMAYKTITDPTVYPLQVELAYFVFVATIMPTIALLSMQITRMRDRMKAQKKALEEALIHIEKLAAHDELTGLINRRYMMKVLDDHASRQKRKAIGFSIAMLDLDHFKNINDTWGHAVGDDVLHGFAEAATKTLRECDVLSRWGGEEFLLLMPETNNGNPNTGLERLRTVLAALVLSPNAPDLRVTFSVGLTSYQQGESISDTIHRADKSLYEAKAGGRNRTVVG